MVSCAHTILAVGLAHESLPQMKYIAFDIEGMFTPWTMKSDHVRWLFYVVRLDGPISSKINLQSLWALHYVKMECAPRGLTMHQEMDVLNFLIYVQKGKF